MPPTSASNQASAQVHASMSSLGACMKLSKKHTLVACALAVGSFVLLLLGLLGPGLVQKILDGGIMRAILWLPDSPEPVDVRYRGMCDPTDPRALFAHVTIYLYNITNVDAMRTQQAKPRVVLVGPYRYLKLTCKLDVWWDAQGRASAKDYVRYLPYPGGPLPGDADPDLNIITVNMALAGVVEAVHASMGPEGTRWLDLLVTVLAGWRDEHVNGIFVRRTANELLWGYEDPLLSRLQILLPPGTIPRTRVQLIANATSESEVLASPPSMYNTGLFDTGNIWTVLRDKNLTEVTGWPGGDECVEPVRGTDGTQFTPGLHCTRDKLQVWMSQLFRSTEMVCTGAKTFHGIKLLRYWPNPSWTAPNTCKQQYIPGLLNISAPMAVGAGGNGSLAAGPPIYVSRPHFCGCDLSLRTGVMGLPGCENMDEQLSVWVDVEPITGISMRATQSIMVSSQVTEAAREHLEPRLTASPVIPIVWNYETIEATPEMAAEFVFKVYGARRIKAHLHLWPMLLAVVFASACSCVLVHASITNLKRIQQTQADQVERERLARQDIINQSIINAAAAVSRGTSVIEGLGLGGDMTRGEGNTNGLREPLLPPTSEV